MQSYLDSITTNGFELLNKSASWNSDSSETCIDHFKTQILKNATIEVKKKEGFSDHYPVILVFFLMKTHSLGFVTVISYLAK